MVLNVLRGMSVPATLCILQRGNLKPHTVMRNYGMNQNFADINPERDFQPFNEEKNSHLQIKIS